MRTADASDDEPYAAGTIFVTVMGDSPNTRVLEVLLSEHGNALPASDICRLSGLDRAAFNDCMEILRRWELVVTDEAADEPSYRLNTTSDEAKHLGQFDWSLIEYLADREACGEIDDETRPLLPEER